ncbi:putative phage portal protein [Escherichia coli]|uniref:Putative phage portal protein n=1 Tax=Escherichia coli TaxID=562 RepID=A0A2X3JWH8_ECOLX|nr:putative phage portal protein [Escherichia coli]
MNTRENNLKALHAPRKIDLRKEAELLGVNIVTDIGESTAPQ